MLKLPLHSVLGSDLRKHRKTTRITQAELAAGTGLSVPTIRLLEVGGGNLDSWQKVLDHLDLELTGRNLPGGSTLGQRLARLRRHRGMSQRELAALIKVSQPTLIALERRGQGRLATLERVLVALGAGTQLGRRGESRGFFTGAGNSSMSQAWETPPELLEALSTVFGRFDLDPCAPRKTRTRVKARSHFTAEDDGLTLPWHG